MKIFAFCLLAAAGIAGLDGVQSVPTAPGRRRHRSRGFGDSAGVLSLTSIMST